MKRLLLGHVLSRRFFAQKQAHALNITLAFKLDGRSPLWNRWAAAGLGIHRQRFFPLWTGDSTDFLDGRSAVLDSVRETLPLLDT